MNFSDQRHWWWLALALLMGALIALLGPVLTPFVVSALLAWLGNPLVDGLQKRGWSRTVSVGLVFLLMTLVLILAVLVAVPLLERQASYLFQNLPVFGQWLKESALPWMEERTGLELAGYFDPGTLIELLKSHWQQAGGIAATVLGGISKSGLTLLAWAANLMLIPVVTFFFMRDWPVLVEKVRSLIPRPLEPTVTRLTRESDSVLSAFLRGQVSVMLALGVTYWIGLWAIGIELSFLIGMGAGLVSFVPYLGAIVGVGAGLIAAIVQHGDMTHILLVLLVFGVGQTLESFVYTPYLVGDRIGLHPVAVIFAIMAGGQLFGFIGILLALPVAAVAMVLLRFLHQRYTESDVYRDDPAPVAAGSPLLDAGGERIAGGDEPGA